MNEWVGRCCASLAGGHQVADIALLYPVESLWPQFRPRGTGPMIRPVRPPSKTPGARRPRACLPAQRDFTVIDSRTLAEARVESGALVHGNLRWRVVVLPGVDTLPQAAWENLDAIRPQRRDRHRAGSAAAKPKRNFPRAESRRWRRNCSGRRLT